MLTITEDASLPDAPSAAPLGKEVEIMIELFPETRLMAGSITFMLELGLSEPVQE
jgi:hypothetical protein